MGNPEVFYDTAELQAAEHKCIDQNICPPQGDQCPSFHFFTSLEVHFIIYDILIHNAYSPWVALLPCCMISKQESPSCHLNTGKPLIKNSKPSQGFQKAHQIDRMLQKSTESLWAKKKHKQGLISLHTGLPIIISQPPKNSPSMYTWGKVGQALYSFMPAPKVGLESASC